MSQNNPWHLAVFACSLGLMIYLASALWSALFIIDLPQDRDAVVDAVEIQHEEGGRYNDYSYTESRPTKFKNTLEELKYYHNLSMLERNQYWNYGVLAFGALAGFVTFYLVPRWRGSVEVRIDPIPTAFIGGWCGGFVAMFIPMILGWILPAPVEWFPSEIREIADLRQKAALSQLEQVAAMQNRYDEP
jgi:hypothetical protein